LDCIELKINGVSEIQGNVRAKTGKINGRAGIKGNLESEEFKVSGYSDFHGNVQVKEIKIEGSVEIKGNLSGEEVEIKGGLKVKGDCEAEVFVLKGTVTIGGLLNAGNIDICLYGSSQAKEIGGEKIRIRKDKANNCLGLSSPCSPFPLTFPPNPLKVTKSIWNTPGPKWCGETTSALDPVVKSNWWNTKTTSNRQKGLPSKTAKK